METLKLSEKKFVASIAASANAEVDEGWKEFFFRGDDCEEYEWKMSFYISKMNGRRGRRGLKELRIYHWPISSIYILSGKCFVNLGSSALSKTGSPTVGVVKGIKKYPWTTICEIPTLEIPPEQFYISFNVAYRKIVEDIGSGQVPFHRCPTNMISKFSKDFEDLFLSGKSSDVTFIVGDETIPAHKCILIARVPYFERMFSTGMVESETNRIKIDDAEPATFKELLRYVYCGKLPTDMTSSPVNLLPLSEKYDLPLLKDACEVSLERKLDKGNLCDMLVFSDIYRCSRLKSKCFARMKEWKTVLEKDDLEGLRRFPDLMMDIILSFR